MPDEQLLDGLDPVELMESEAARLEEHFARLGPEGWERPSRCEGWSTRDLLAHLAASEDYHHACLDGRVAELMQELGERGATDVASFNALGIDDRRDLSHEALLRAWSEADAETRRRFRERGDGEVDSSIGAYPARWQAFHLAGELATHADDLQVVVPEADRAARREWRARFSRFALQEAKPDLALDLDISDDDLIEAVAGRPTSTPLDPELLAQLSTMP